MTCASAADGGVRQKLSILHITLLFKKGTKVAETTKRVDEAIVTGAPVIGATAVGAGVKVEGQMDRGIDTAGGDFVGRDNSVFTGRDIITIHGDVHGGVVIYPNTAVGRIGTQIERLRGRVTRLIPAEEALNYFIKIRENSTFNRIGGEVTTHVSFLNLGSIKARLFTLSSEKETNKDNENADHYLTQLSDIEAQIAPGVEGKQLSDLLQHLSNIADEVNVRISKLNVLFVSLVYPAASSPELIENMVSKIGHKELREEARMHLGVVKQLARKLDIEQLTGKDFDVLSDEVQAAVGVMTEIEQRQILVKKLLRSDRSRKNWTVAIVIAYIATVIATIIYLTLRWGSQFVIGQTSLHEMRLPLLGIPWPVVVWSLIGSFAAMIHRFNRRPIYDFSDAIKWLLTRPVQGVVLGSAFYLVLISGLFLLTGDTSANSSGMVTVDEVILVLVFLVGFSDRFADGVFNTLVDKYTSKKEENITD